MDNPLRFTDPSGLVAGDYFDLDGNFIGTDGKLDKIAYVVYDKVKSKKLEQRDNFVFPVAGNVVPAIEAAVEQSNSTNSTDPHAGFHEESVVVDKDGNTVAISTFNGPYSPDPSNGANVISATADNTALVAHVHPKGDGKPVEVRDPNSQGRGLVLGPVKMVTPRFRQEPSTQTSSGARRIEPSIANHPRNLNSPYRRQA